MEYEKKPSKFTWEGLGDIGEGRKNLGDSMPVIVYRLFQYTLKDILAREYSPEQAAALYRAAGHLAGTEFARHLLDLTGDFDYFVANLQNQLQNFKVGIMKIEKANLETLSLTLTVSEDLDCSGLPVTDETVCDYDEGFIAGILEAYTGKAFNVIEIDCWASGDRTCRFTAKPIK
ncbi:MAG: 4-vinyl reductase [Clostridiales bacterium]|jgi:predicted hydrocarbon binding protein|nr:4-vinyl reductase [Clostridiales bacterium]